MENIYNAIQNVYNMDKTTWQEVLAGLYNSVSKFENKFDSFENKFGMLLGEEVTRELKKMYDDGSLTSIINDKILKDINTKVDKLTELKYRNINNSEIEVGNLSSNGEVISENTYFRTKSFIKVVGGKTIYLKKLTGANVYHIFEYDEYYNFIKSTDKIYEYNQKDHTITLQLSENTKYIKFKAWWTEPITDIKIAVYYDGCGIIEYEDYTDPKLVIKGSLVDNSNKVPVICFNFDDTNLDNRYIALQNVGFTGTWQFTKESLLYSKDVINTLIQNGHDISPYYGLSDDDYKDTTKHSANITKMKEEVTKILNDMKKLGIYNPVMFSCSRHRGGYVVNEAIKDLKFKYVRCTWGVNQQGDDYYVSNLNGADKKEQYPFPLTKYNTFEKAKTEIDILISNGASLIMPMCHSLSYDNITEDNYFENLVAYIKTLSDKGKVKVMNMREYYEYHYPIQGEKDDRVRIMSNINDIKNLQLT